MSFKTLGISIAVVVVTFAVYWPTLNGDFLWDDNLWLQDNPQTLSDSGLVDPWIRGTHLDYWPLTSNAFWIQYRLWGNSSTGYRAVNIVLHALGALLGWRVLAKLKIPAPALAAAIFAVHPVTVASVAWITELKNTLSFVLCLATILVYLRFDDQKRYGWYVLAIVVFLLTLLTKTSIVMLPIVLLLLIWWRHRRVSPADWLRSVPFFAMSLIFGLITILFQSRTSGSYATADLPALARLSVVGKSLWFYLYKAIAPFHLSMIYPRWQVDELTMISFLASGLAIATAAVLFIYRKRWSRGPVVALGCFCAMLMPVLGFVYTGFMRYSFVSDHFQYAALLAVIALVVGIGAYAADRLKIPGRVTATVACGVLLTLSVLTWQRAAAFANSQSLWADTKQKNPDAWVAWGMLAKAHMDAAPTNQRDNELILQLLDKGIELNPRYAIACNLRGFTKAQLGRHSEAVEDYNKAISIRPDFVIAYSNRGMSHRQLGNIDLAREDYNKAIDLSPHLADAYNNLGNLNFVEGNYRQAIESFSRAIELEPNHFLAHANRAQAWIKLNQPDKALADLTSAIGINPDSILAYLARAEFCRNTGQLDLSLADCNSALGLNGADHMAHYQMGLTLQATRQTEAAVKHLKISLKIQRGSTALNALAWIWATEPSPQLRDGAAALKAAEFLCKVTEYDDAGYLQTLAAACAETGQFDRASQTVQKAIELATRTGNTELVENLTYQLDSYKNHQPWRNSVAAKKP